MMRPRILASAVLLALLLATPAAAAGAAPRGVVPAGATVHGQTLTSLAEEWGAWAFGPAPDVNPIVNGTCGPSPNDPRIWFLPVSLGGDYDVTCHIPTGVWLFVTPGGWDCSTANDGLTDVADLQACAAAGSALIESVELSIDGRTYTGLGEYLMTTGAYLLPDGNIIAGSATPDVLSGYFLLVHPLTPGEHYLHAYDDFPTLDFDAGIGYRITVG
jgi:hypothetical protein